MSGSDDSVPHTRDPACIKAEQDGFLVIAREGNQLLLDLDDGRQIDEQVYAAVCDKYGKPRVEEWASKSGRGRHVVLSFGAGFFQKSVGFTDAEAVALAVALGSDPMRGLMDVQRIRKGVPQPSVLFRPTDKVKLASTYDDLTQEQTRQVFTAANKLVPA